MKSAAFLLFGLAAALLIAAPNRLAAQRRTSGAAAEYVTGRVMVRASTPARSVWVILYDGKSEKGRSLTGDDGKYFLGNLERKSYTLVVRRQIGGANLVRNQVSLPSDRVHNMSLP